MARSSIRQRFGKRRRRGLIGGSGGDPLPQPAGHALFDLIISASLEPGQVNRQPSLPVTTIDVDLKINVIAVGRPRVCLYDRASAFGQQVGMG